MADKRLDGVIFDLDGVLVTTDKFHYQAWKMLADEKGMEFNEVVNHQLRGVSRSESLKRIYRHNKLEIPGPAEFEAQMTRKNERYKELIATMTPEDILPGSIPLLEELREKGIKCAIASASKNTPKVLDVTGLARFIDGVADGNQARNSKPDPEVFLLAAKNIGCLPENCIGVEDAESGVLAIQRAGMVSVGIGQAARAADYVVDGVVQLSYAVLAKVFSNAIA